MQKSFRNIDSGNKGTVNFEQLKGKCEVSNTVTSTANHRTTYLEAAWPSGKGAGLVIRRSRVPILHAL